MKTNQLTLKDYLKSGHCKVRSEPWKKIKKKKIKVDYSIFFKDLQCFGIDKPVPEYKFHKTRKWRVDFAWPDHKLALEIEGGIWVKGRHNRPSGFIKDMEKYNQLAIYRFHLIRVTPEEIQNGVAVEIVNQFFN